MAGTPIDGKPAVTTILGTERVAVSAGTDTGGVGAGATDRKTTLDKIKLWIEANFIGLFNSIKFIAQAIAPAWEAGLLFYDEPEESLTFYNNRSATAKQLGRELGPRCLNDTGVTITDGSVVYVSGDNGTVRTIALADATTAEKALGTIGFATEDILNGEIGEITIMGTVRGLDTSGCTVGEILYLSTTPGSYQSTIPSSPNYEVVIGTCGRVDAVNGQIDAKVIPGSNSQDTINLFNGAILEDHSVTVSSNGTIITLTLEKSGGGDLSLFYDGLFYALDCTPPLTINLTPGTDTVPVRNWVYIPVDTKVLTVSFTGFPTTIEYTPIDDVICQSAASAQTYGVYKNHKWTDHVSNSIGQGHLSHINYWIRNQPATYQSGIDPSVAITVNAGAKDDVYFSTLVGMVLQAHPHVFPAKDMATGEGLYVINRYLLPYSRITNLNVIVNTSDGTTLLGNNTYYTIFIYGIVNEEESECKYFGNAPSGFYTNSTDAINDPNGYTNKSMLSDYRGTAFPIAGVVLRYQTAASGTITLVQLTNLLEESVGGGSPTGISTSTFTDAAFKVINATDPTKIIQLSATGITTGTTRTFTVPDASGTITLGAASSTDNAIAIYDGTTGKILQNGSALNNDDGSFYVIGATVGNLRLVSLAAAAIPGDLSGVLEFYKTDASLGGAGVVSFIRSKAIDSGGTYNLEFGTGTIADTAAKMILNSAGNLLIILAPTTDTTFLPPLVRDTSTGEIKSADLSYTALTAGAAVAYDLTTGMHRTLNVAVDTTITFSEMATAAKNPFGDIRLNVTVISSVILAGTGVTFNGIGNLTALPVGVYHLAFTVISATQIDYNISEAYI